MAASTWPRSFTASCSTASCASTGQLPGGYKAFETRMRIEFHDEADGTTRVEVRQWLPESYAAPTVNGWGEAFAKLDATLAM